VQRFPKLSFAAVIVVWASAFSVIKALLDHGIGAEQIALARYVIAAPGFVFLLWRAGGLPGLNRRDATRVIVAGIVIVAGYHLSLNLGEQSTSSGIAALIVALSPALTMALAIAFGIERFSSRLAVGLAVAFAGVVVVVGLGSGEEFSLEGIKGPLIVVGAPLSFALYNVLLKPLFVRYDLLALTATTSLIGTVGGEIGCLRRDLDLRGRPRVDPLPRDLLDASGLRRLEHRPARFRAHAGGHGHLRHPGARRPLRRGDARGARDGVDRRRRAPDRRRGRAV
jgi:drug/metabolite transporter (DMT)-like permease